MPGVLGRVARREANGCEGEYAHQRAAQKRPLGLVHDGLRNIQFLRTALHADQDALGDDDGVVDHHAQRDDQRAQRDPVHRDAADTHGGECREDRQQQNRADDRRGSEAHENEERDDHDDERRDHVDDEVLNRGIDDRALVIVLVQLDAYRAAALRLGDARIDVLPDLDDVAAEDAGHADRDRRLAVVAIEFARRRLVAAPHAGDIAQINHAPVGCGGDQQILDGFDRVDGPARVDDDALVANRHIPRRYRGVLLRQDVVDVGDGHAEGGRVFARDLHEDRLRQRAVDGHLGDAVDLQQVLLQGLGVTAELGGRVAVAGEKVIEPVNVAEIVIDNRGSGPGRQRLLGVVDLVPKLRPDQLQIGLGLGELILDVDRELGDVRRGNRLDAVDLLQLADLALQRVGDFLCHFDGACAGVLHDDLRRADREFRILEAGHVLVGVPAAHDRQKDDDDAKDGVPYAELGQVHGSVGPGADLHAIGEERCACRRDGFTHGQSLGHDSGFADAVANGDLPLGYLHGVGIDDPDIVGCAVAGDR